MLELLKKHSVNEDACTLCFDAKACMEVIPCGHKGNLSKGTDNKTV